MRINLKRCIVGLVAEESVIASKEGVLIRLDVAESLLRRGIWQFQLERVQVERGRDDE